MKHPRSKFKLGQIKSKTGSSREIIGMSLELTANGEEWFYRLNDDSYVSESALLMHWLRNDI